MSTHNRSYVKAQMRRTTSDGKDQIVGRRQHAACDAQANARHDAWIRASIEEGLRERGPGIPHDRVVAELKKRLDARIAKARKRTRRVDGERSASML